MTALNTTSLDSAVSLIRSRFLKKSWEARSDESVTVAFEISRCLAVTSDLDRFKRAYELFDAALGRWREGFARVAEESFRELCSLASAHPEWIEADPIEWARAQIDALIVAELDGKFLGFYMRSCEGNHCIPPRNSAVQTEVWLAPSWVEGRPVLGRPWSDERLTARATNSVLRLERSGFEQRAQYVLDDAVEKARIDLACRPLSEGQNGSREKSPDRGQKLVSSSPSQIPKFRSALKKAVYAYLVDHRDASDKEILEWLVDSNPTVVPIDENRDVDRENAGKTFTKVRKHFKPKTNPPQDDVNHQNPPVIHGVAPVSH